MAGKRVVLTADRSLMTNYRGNFLYGFIACGPYEVLPEWVFDKVFCPSVETDKITGEVKVAQVGLRRVESSLLQGGYKRNEVFLAHPEMLHKSIGPDTKVVGINVMDPLGMAPVTTTMSPEKLSYVAMKFKKMCASIIQLKKKYGFKVVVGGNGAWELAKSDRMKIHGIDTVVVGEADELAIDLFQDLERGDAPELMHCFVRNLENIPVIEGPTINSLIEAMRGCGRGCDFCDVNKRSKKDLPLERLQYEAKINLDYGFDSIWLHSDEMLLYGCDSRDFVPNRDVITDLWKGLKGIGANFIGTTHMTFSGVAADPTLMQQISHINKQDETGRWLATNLGIETVSPALVKKHLGVKTKPFSPEEWGSVVMEGAKILNKNHWFPAATIIIGWPDETPEDNQYTIDMIEDFRQMNFRGLVAPLLYQDFSEKNSMHFGNLNEAQFTLFWRCWENNLRVINDIIPIILRNKSYGPPMKVFMYGILRVGTWAILRYLRGLCKDLFNGRTPEEIMDKYARSRSVTAPIIQTKKL
ncbi:B12-binding domain-containing radical SAM protein [Marine Group I thaumarchaeote]|uniref:B12-binding domain-containing radical SAM protein n=1 Tax=Marine Group I thaumarchaeote TaxID=2511932 RepID=A0A7K4MKW9_9ARCH|nr:B12-binding domain-containing radical SAM protein [Marine Group I thaumarchaeote]